MNDKKICFITCVNDEFLYEESVLYIKHLHVPVGMQVDLLGYIAIAWQHRIYITDKKDLCMALDNWLKMVNNNVISHKSFSPDKDENSKLIMALMRMISARQYNNAIKTSVKYLMSYSESNRKVIMNEWKKM